MLHSVNDITIRPFGESDSIDELTDLLHRSYKALADMGLKFLATHQTPDVTRQRIADGVCLVAERGGRIVGTITYYPPGHAKGSPWFERAGVAHIGQMAVEPQLQRRGIASQLMKHVEEFARAQHAQELALDTAESASHLIDWYTRLGYRFVEHVQWNVTNYRSVVLSKTL
jgi:GNAT superfamily N-acetyltransferase